MTEKYTKSIQSETYDLEEREGITEDFLHLMVGLQSLFDHMELISNGISTLIHHRRLSPLLVDRKSVVMRVREVQVEQREKGLELMISPTDIWQTPISYVITRDLSIHIMSHLPIGRSSSFRKVFRYILTPLTFGDDTEHFMVGPRNPYLLLDKNGQHPTEMSTEEMSECESVNHYEKYCPARSVIVNRAPPSCLSSLHSGDCDHVLKLCPVVLVDDKFPYVASLAFGVFTVYTKPKLMTNVYCGEEQVATHELQGLSRIMLRRDCCLAHDDFALEPTIDFGDQDNELSEITLTFDNDLNMSQVLEWGSKNGLLRQSDQGNWLTMLEVAGRWNHDQFDELRCWTFQIIIGVAGASIMGLVVCCFCTRECWNMYMRAKQRRAMSSSIREQVREYGMEMRNLLSRGVSPSAPMQPASEIS